MSDSRVFGGGSSGSSAWDSVARGFEDALSAADRRDATPPAPAARRDETPAPVDDAGGHDDAPRRRRRQTADSQFTGPLAPLQVKLPSDLIASLKLLSFDEGITVQQLVFKFLTTSDTVPKVWLQRRAAG